MKKVAVLASGRGSNLQSLLRAEPDYGSYRIELVVSNKTGAGALEIASAAGRRGLLIPSRDRAREEHEAELLRALRTADVDVLCLAGYMRVLTPGFIREFGRPILNIHPSLLPAFPGLHAQRQALDARAILSGATVHLVDAGVDTGPILRQESVPVLRSDTEETLSARILEVEHRLYPAALDAFLRKTQTEVRATNS